MTAWIVLLTSTALFALAVRHGRSSDPPPLPNAYERERQLAELRALVAANTHGRLP